MNTPREILDALGREAVAAALGVNMRRVNRAALEPQLPALWWAKLSDMNGEDLPRHLFTFKGMNAA